MSETNSAMISAPARTQPHAVARTEESGSRSKREATSLGKTAPSCDVTVSAVSKVGAWKTFLVIKPGTAFAASRPPRRRAHGALRPVPTPRQTRHSLRSECDVSDGGN